MKTTNPKPKKIPIMQATITTTTTAARPVNGKAAPIPPATAESQSHPTPLAILAEAARERASEGRAHYQSGDRLLALAAEKEACALRLAIAKLTGPFAPLAGLQRAAQGDDGAALVSAAAVLECLAAIAKANSARAGGGPALAASYRLESAALRYAAETLRDELPAYEQSN